MTVNFHCPSCEQLAILSLPPASVDWTCPKCGTSVALHVPADPAEWSPLRRCILCSGERFYAQRDFNQRLGCVVAGIGAVLSPFTYGISLLVCLIIDGILYLLLKQATVCYRCGSIYRGMAGSSPGPFDLHVAELEAHERKYLEPDRP